MFSGHRDPRGGFFSGGGGLLQVVAGLLYQGCLCKAKLGKIASIGEGL